jgi:hypothetical protein
VTQEGAKLVLSEVFTKAKSVKVGLKNVSNLATSFMDGPLLPFSVIGKDEEPQNEGLNGRKNSAGSSAMLNKSELKHGPVIELKSLTFPTDRKISICVPEQKLFQLDGQLGADGLTFQPCDASDRWLGYEETPLQKGR